ncbi:MAG TPA: aldose 1-epimerase [Solirubrobacteraceae bacterium]|nr:aldose 1-epimerase [Solirubrobacteraceae bacterium]
MATVLDPGVIELIAPEGGLTARFATHAGMVGCSLRHRGEELLGLGGGLDAYVHEGKVFGIPVLYPWANRLGGWAYEACGRRVELDRESPLLHGDEHCLPIHGALAGASSWRVVDRGDSWLTAALDFGAHPELLAVFPYPHVLELAIRLTDRTLTIDTTVAADDAPVPLSFGFHPYLAPPGDRAAWWVELPARTALALDDRNLPTGEATDLAAEAFALAARTYDDLFAVAPGAQFSVTAAGRRATVEMTAGYPYAQVFAPPDQAVICFEPMTAPVDALRSHVGLRSVPADGTVTATFSVRVESPPALRPAHR